MKVFKFGGTSVRDAEAVKNVTEIIKSFNDKMVVVASAIGVTTNALEQLLSAYFKRTEQWQEELNKIKEEHYAILSDLFEPNHDVHNIIGKTFEQLEGKLNSDASMNYDYEYDQIVSYGEIISTIILNEYLKSTGVNSQWFDIRKVLKTDDNYREGNVDWELSEELFSKAFDFNSVDVFVTQGFLGSTQANITTTLGRGGSDYSAACVAYLLNGEDVTIWKDVPGVLNADPKWFDDAVKLNNISYHEAIELAYYGANVIHPKTLKPLRSKNIPLYVKSFNDINSKGTVINQNTSEDSLIPSYIFKVNQMLISISPRDYSFIVEENLREIFSLVAKYRIKINLMQNSAISFSVSVDSNNKLPLLIAELKDDYRILYNENMELVTIRHYDQETIDRILEGKEVFLVQKSRQTARFVVKPA